VAVLQPGSALNRDAMVAHYTGRVAKWCIPDELVIAPELPYTATGKLLKSMIRKLYCTTASFRRPRRIGDERASGATTGRVVSSATP
jgi:acyl-CoA synthetase (AMP-forming)/AMP-acid ligase II